MRAKPEAGAQGRPVGAGAPENLLGLLLAQAARAPRKVSMRYKRTGAWQEISWSEVAERVRKAALGLTALGVKPGDRVAVFSPTRYEWTLANMAIFGAGAVTVPIYASSTPAEAEHILRDAGCKAAFVDDDTGEGRLVGRFSRIASVRASLPELQQVIAFDMGSDAERGILAFADLEKRGEGELPTRASALEEQAAALGREDLAFVIYTSGTTGKPKGVMLTHGNWTSQATAIAGLSIISAEDEILLFLPLAHVFALVVVAAWLGTGASIIYAQSVERAIDNAGETHPTCMVAVPRVFEKVYNKVVSDGASAPGARGKLFGWALHQFEAWAAARARGEEDRSLGWALARKLVFSQIEAKLDARLGGRLRRFISGGAPLSPKLGYFFQACGFEILEGYGLTETSAPTHANRPGRIRIGTVGQPFPGVEVRIAEDGEVLLKGPPIMKGYWKQPQETESSFQDGWFKTGDIGHVDGDGYLKITDRKKDLIKTSGGKFVAPQELENALKSEPLVSQVLIHGDRRKFVSALITLSEERVQSFAKEKGLPAASYPELTRHPEIRARIQAAVDALNAVQPAFATIKKFAVLDHDWTIESGDLTPSLKVKRAQVTAKYKSVLDGFYEGERFD